MAFDTRCRVVCMVLFISGHLPIPLRLHWRVLAHDRAVELVQISSRIYSPLHLHLRVDPHACLYVVPSSSSLALSPSPPSHTVARAFAHLARVHVAWPRSLEVVT